MTMKTENRLPLALLLLRLSVFLVMFVWTIDKFVEPQHASKIMAEFYLVSGVALYYLRDADVLWTIKKSQ